MLDEQVDDALEDTEKRKAVSTKLILPASAPLPDPYATQYVPEHSFLPVNEQHTVAMPEDWQQAQRMKPIELDQQPTFRLSLQQPTPTFPAQASRNTMLRSRPAYALLFAGIGLFLIVGIVCAVLVFNAFAQGGVAARKGNSGPIIINNNGTPGNAPQATAGTQDSATAGSIANGHQPVPTPTTTVVKVQSTPTPNGTLTLRITNYPQTVNNNATIPITILASQPGVQVQLLITYNAPPNFYGSAPTTTDGAGNATLNWHVRVFARRGTVIARMIVVARNSKGQIARSQLATITVRINR